jgi:hypothetical protein
MTETIWTRLAAPIDPARIAWRQDGKVTKRGEKFIARFVPYIEANTVRQRLDDVAPGWSSRLKTLDAAGDSDGTPMQAFRCVLTIKPVGETPTNWATREDVGQGSDYKSAATDAFKRAGVRFGIGQELYEMEMIWVEMDGDGKYAKPIEDPAEVYAKLLKKNGSGEQRRDPPKAHRATTSSPASSATSTVRSTGSAPNGVPDCPACLGAMWDNRAKKRSGEFKATAADFVCRDKACGASLNESDLVHGHA